MVRIPDVGRRAARGIPERVLQLDWGVSKMTMANSRHVSRGLSLSFTTSNWSLNFLVSPSLRIGKLERWLETWRAWGYYGTFWVFSVPVYTLLMHSLSRFQMWTLHFALNASFSIGPGFWVKFQVGGCHDHPLVGGPVSESGKLRYYDIIVSLYHSLNYDIIT